MINNTLDKYGFYVSTEKPYNWNKKHGVDKMKTTKPQTEQTEEKKPVNNKPTNKWAIYPVTISEWTNDEMLSYTIQKSYKDKEGNWLNTQNYNEADLCIIAKILSKI